MNVISFEYRYKVHELKFSYFAIFKRANIKKDNLVARVIVSVNFSSSITAHDGRRWMRSFTRGGTQIHSSVDKHFGFPHSLRHMRAYI